MVIVPPSLSDLVPDLVIPAIVGTVEDAAVVVDPDAAAVVDDDAFAVVVEDESLFLLLEHAVKSRPTHTTPAARVTRFFMGSPVVVSKRLRKEICDERERAQDEHRGGRNCFGAGVAELGVGANRENEIDHETERCQHGDWPEHEADEQPKSSEDFHEAESANEVGALAQAFNKVENFLGHGEVVSTASKHDERGDDREEDCCTTHGLRRYSAHWAGSGMPRP